MISFGPSIIPWGHHCLQYSYSELRHIPILIIYLYFISILMVARPSVSAGTTAEDINTLISENNLNWLNVCTDGAGIYFNVNLVWTFFIVLH